MQNPPPGPPPGGDQPGYTPSGGDQPGYRPPGQPPPSYPQQGFQHPHQTTSGSGVDKKTGAILSYLLWWVTGIIFLFVGKDDPDVKYHAAQSTVFFGAMTVIFWVFTLLSNALGILHVVEAAVGVYTVVVWVICLVRANSLGGQRFQIPLVGSYVTPYAEQLANAV